LTFFAVAVDCFWSPLDPTRPGLVVLFLGSVLTCFAPSLVSTPYGVALRRFAAFSANQYAATCLAAKLVLARGTAGTFSAAWAGVATAAPASRPATTPPQARARFTFSPFVIGGALTPAGQWRR